MRLWGIIEKGQFGGSSGLLIAMRQQASRLRCVMLDLRGAGCATVLIRLAATARIVEPNTSVVVWTEDRGAPNELPAWCRMTGHRYLGAHTTEHDQYELILNPTGAQP